MQGYVIFSIILSSLLFILMLVTNTLANTLPINGQQTGEISNSYPNLFQPAGLTFSIWGVIYVLLAIFAISQITLIFNSPTSLDSKPLFYIHIFFSLSSLFNISWLFAWHHHRILLSLVLMIALLVVLGIIYMELSGLPIIAQASFKIYFGWISIATIANITIYLVKLGIDYRSQSSIIITAIVFVVGLLFGLYMLFYQHDYYVAGVFLWAYLGIFINHYSKDGWNNAFPLLVYASLSITVVFAISIIIKYIFWRTL